MTKSEILKILELVKKNEIDLEEAISYLMEYCHTEDLVTELEDLNEVSSKSKFDRRLDELILDVENVANYRRITKRDLLENKVVRQSTIDSLNEVIRNILKENQWRRKYSLAKLLYRLARNDKYEPP